MKLKKIVQVTRFLFFMLPLAGGVLLIGGCVEDNTPEPEYKIKHIKGNLLAKVGRTDKFYLESGSIPMAGCQVTFIADESNFSNPGSARVRRYQLGTPLSSLEQAQGWPSEAAGEWAFDLTYNREGPIDLTARVELCSNIGSNRIETIGILIQP